MSLVMVCSAPYEGRARRKGFHLPQGTDVFLTEGRGGDFLAANRRGLASAPFCRSHRLRLPLREEMATSFRAGPFTVLWLSPFAGLSRMQEAGPAWACSALWQHWRNPRRSDESRLKFCRTAVRDFLPQPECRSMTHIASLGALFD